MKRILPFLFLLPVLVVSASWTQVVPSAIANDDRPSSPQPAIAPSAVPAKLTIESLAGTYKGAVDENALKKSASEAQKLVRKLSNNDRLEITEASLRKALERLTITINADSTFEYSFIVGQRDGRVKRDGNKLIFTAEVIKIFTHGNKPPEVSKCSQDCTFTLDLSADGKMLVFQGSALPLRGYVKQ